MDENTFCSVLSRRRNDHLIGSASHFNKLLLIEYKAPWAKEAFAGSKINEPVKKKIADFIQSQRVKLLLIKNHGNNENGIRVFAYNLTPGRECSNAILLKNYDELLTTDLGMYFEQPVHPVKQPLYLVCTNGKKDKCCSKFGLPVYQELLGMGKDAWQCTHVGGDRFAPNIVSLPGGLFFGHVALNEIPDIVAAIESNRIFSLKYRGRSSYNNYEQAAEYFLMKQLNDFTTDSIGLIHSDQISGTKRTVLLASRDNGLTYAVEVEKELSPNTELLTCSASKESHLPVFKLLSIRQQSNA